MGDVGVPEGKLRALLALFVALARSPTLAVDRAGITHIEEIGWTGVCS